MRCEAKRAELRFRFCFCVAPFLDVDGFRHEAVESSPLVIGVILGAPISCLHFHPHLALKACQQSIARLLLNVVDPVCRICPHSLRQPCDFLLEVEKLGVEVHHSRSLQQLVVVVSCDLAFWVDVSLLLHG